MKTIFFKKGTEDEYTKRVREHSSYILYPKEDACTYHSKNARIVNRNVLDVIDENKPVFVLVPESEGIIWKLTKHMEDENYWEGGLKALSPMDIGENLRLSLYITSRLHYIKAEQEGIICFAGERESIQETANIVPLEKMFKFLCGDTSIEELKKMGHIFIQE